MGSIGFEELLLILVVSIIVFGGKLPQVARKAARFYVQARNYVTQMRDEVMKHIPEEKELLGDPRNQLPGTQDYPLYMDPSDPEYKKPADGPAAPSDAPAPAAPPADPSAPPQPSDSGKPGPAQA